jgi:hypothetical protein
VAEAGGLTQQQGQAAWRGERGVATSLGGGSGGQMNGVRVAGTRRRWP